MKTCRDCGEEKPESEFYSHPTTHDRLLPQCKKCKISYAKTRRDATLEVCKARDRARHQRKKDGL